MNSLYDPDFVLIPPPHIKPLTYRADRGHGDKTLMCTFIHALRGYQHRRCDNAAAEPPVGQNNNRERKSRDEIMKPGGQNPPVESSEEIFMFQPTY